MAKLTRAQQKVFGGALGQLGSSLAGLIDSITPKDQVEEYEKLNQKIKFLDSLQ